MTTPRFFCWTASLSVPLASALAGPADQEPDLPGRSCRSLWSPDGPGYVLDIHQMDVAVGVVGCEGVASYQPEMVYGNEYI